MIEEVKDKHRVWDVIGQYEKVTIGKEAHIAVNVTVA